MVPLGLAYLPVFVGALWATALALDGFGRAVFTQAEFLAALIVLGGAYPPDSRFCSSVRLALAGLVAVLCLGALRFLGRPPPVLAGLGRRR